MAPVVDLIAYKSFFGQCNTGAYDQRCEPKTDSRFFRSFLFDFSQQKTDCLKSVFRLSKKTETEKPTRFFSVVFFMSATSKTPTYLYGNPVMDGHMDSFGTQ